MPDTMQRVRLVQRHRTLKHCYIFSSNDKCNLDVVGKLLSCLKEKLGIKMLAFKNHFSLSDSTDMCDSTIPDLPMDFAIFVVHAEEDRFLFNDDSARIYRALLNATGDRAICVITGDRNQAEKQAAGAVLSHWARSQVSSQFSEDFLDGRKSFIFSWDKQHRAIHEEAILHYFDPRKKNKTFVPVEHRKQDKQNNKMEKSDASSNADHEMETSDEERNQANIKCVHLFNCDQTYKLDVVEKLFKAVEPKLNFAFSIHSHYFVLRDMSEVCENIIRFPDQIKADDVAVFVVHAHESHLSINADNDRIGYSKIYRAFLQATGDKVLVVMGGDDSYKDSAEEQGSFLSRWARRKISSQFSEEYLDGRKSFIFSWDKEHRSIHEEALLHYFNPDKKGEKFVPVKKGVEVRVTQVVPKQEVECRERREISVKRSGTEAEENFSSKIRTGVQRVVQHSPHTENAKAPLSIKSVPDPGLKKEEDEPMDESNEPFEDFEKIAHADIPAEVSLPKTEPERTRFEGKDTSPPHLERPINPEESTLVFKTRLRLGKISYDERDVKVRLEGWTAPQKMAENLLRDWHTISNVEFSVYHENETGNEHIVVTEDLESRVSRLAESFKGAFRLVGLPSVGTNATGAGVTSSTEFRADVINVGGANVLGAITQFGSNLRSGSLLGKIEATGSIASEEGPPDGCSSISSAESDPDILPD